MTTVTVVSDTHGNRKFFEEINGVLSESNRIIHLGDTSSDGQFLRRQFPDKTTVINGNCDCIYKLGSDEEVLQIEGVKIFACHGHMYSVKTTLARLAARAKELGCTVALYGHTHEAREDKIDGVTLLNPGTGSRYSYKSYLYLIVCGDKITYKTVKL